MQLDMHYYGTYAMARSAGLTEEACKIIATAAQFVDDNPGTTTVKFRDTARLDLDATAHHPANLHNLWPEDQRHVWVPFHFLPGGEGKTYKERLVCRKDSKLAREMVKNNLEQNKKPFALELLGITAHVYADTFSHYGFSGVGSHENDIVNDSIELHEKLDPEIRKYIAGKASGFIKKNPKAVALWRRVGRSIVSFSAEHLAGPDGSLGHGAVATYPDRPYLVWRFDYEHSGEKGKWRNNPETFMEACEALHSMFQEFGRLRPDHLEEGIAKPFERIRSHVQRILSLEAAKAERIEAWKKSMLTGELTKEVQHHIPEYEESIPEYVEDGKEWHEQLVALDKTESSDPILELSAFRFFQAAAAHRTYVMRDLMPQNGLVID